MKLLVFNYAMDEHNPIFSHQCEIVERLARHYSQVTVITSHLSSRYRNPELRVLDARWNSQSPFLSVFRFFFLFIIEIIRNKPDVVFSHMTELQSATTAPVTKLLRIPHYLWYAHASFSLYLKWSTYFVDGIITSTVGSCPYSGPKKICIGQSINQHLFVFREHNIRIPLRLIHVGRIDPSKRLETLISLSKTLSGNHYINKLLLVGSPTKSSQSENYPAQLKELVSRFRIHVDFLEAVPRENLPNLLAENDIFVHAFEGSLDKTLIEATMSGLPVLTLNEEYGLIFGNWGTNNEKCGSLISQFQYLISLNEKELRAELIRRRDIAIKEHSLESWIEKLNNILQYRIC